MSDGRDSYATMLLTMALSPDREEYAHPFAAREFHALLRQLRAAGLNSLSALMGMDITQMMDLLLISEEQALRLYTLINRAVTMNYGIEALLMQGITEMTSFHSDYPARLNKKLGDLAPPMLYVAGETTLLDKPAIAVMGIRGVKTDASLREGVESLVRQAVARDYAVLTGGEPGVSRVAADAIVRAGGVLIDIVDGSMREHLEEPTVAKLLEEKRCAVLSIEHPEALPTVIHALSRNRLLFALARAAFICRTDGRRGETEALQNRTCGYIYVWTGDKNSAPLVHRGAIPINDLSKVDFDELSKKWEQSESEQLDIFSFIG